MTNLQWEGASKRMYDAILQEIPSIFRGRVKRDIEKWIDKNNIHSVTEDIVFKAVDEIAPAGLANNRIKPALEKLRA